MEHFKGIFTALLTPFDGNNKVNEKELEKLVKFNIEKGVCQGDGSLDTL